MHESQDSKMPLIIDNEEEACAMAEALAEEMNSEGFSAVYIGVVVLPSHEYSRMLGRAPDRYILSRREALFQAKVLCNTVAGD